MVSIASKFLAKKNVVLSDIDAEEKLLSSKDKSVDKLRTLALAEKLAAYQDLLYAQKKHKILVILQGMDTSGKDGTVRAVFGQINPLGARCYCFKAPTAIESAHDYLWRVHQQVPALGEIAIFNRSHYEDVLITRVHQWISAAEVPQRFAHINAFEKMLAGTGTTIFKFFLHISKSEQKERLEERIADPNKHWKFDANDLKEREYWDDYQVAYQEAIEATNTEYAPWFIIPANSKTQRNLTIASILEEQIALMGLAYPPGNPDIKKLVVK